MHEDIDVFEFWPIYLIAVILGVLCGFFWSLFIIDRAHDRDDVKHLLSELDDEVRRITLVRASRKP